MLQQEITVDFEINDNGYRNRNLTFAELKKSNWR